MGTDLSEQTVATGTQCSYTTAYLPALKFEWDTVPPELLLHQWINCALQTLGLWYFLFLPWHHLLPLFLSTRYLLLTLQVQFRGHLFGNRVAFVNLLCTHLDSAETAYWERLQLPGSCPQQGQMESWCVDTPALHVLVGITEACSHCLPDSLVGSAPVALEGNLLAW